MKIFYFLFLIIGSTISLIAQDILHNQSIEVIYQLYKKEQYQLAIEACDSLLTSLDTLQDRNNYEAIISLKGNILRQTGKPLLAIPLHRKAMILRKELYGEKSLEVSRSLFNIGNCYIDSGLFSNALDFLLASKTLKESQALSESGLINVYNSLSICYENLNDLENAKFYSRKAISVATQIYGENAVQLIFPFNTLANIFLSQNYPDSAFIQLQSALKIQQDSIGLYHSSTLILYNNLAKSLGQSGQYTQAIDWLQDGLRIYQGIDIPNPKIQADCFLNLGNYYLDKGMNKLGLEYLQRANHQYESLVDKFASWNSIGLAYRYLGNIDKAIEQLSMPIEMANGGEMSGNLALTMADIYTNLGSSYLDKKEYEAAQYYIEKGLQIYKSEKGIAFIPSSSYNKLGQCFLGLQEFKLANQHFQKAIAKTKGYHQFGSLYYLGVMNEIQNIPQQALIYYEAALEKLSDDKEMTNTPFPFETIQINDKLANWWLKKARISKAKDDWKQALFYANNAVLILEELRGTIKEYHSEINLQNTFYQIYNYAIEASLTMNQPKQAFYFAERYKSNVLKKTAKETANEHDFNLPKIVLAEIAAINESLTFYKKKRFTLNNQLLSATENKYLETVNDTIGLLVDKKIQWQQRVANEYPSYYQLMEQDSIIKVEEIQASLSTNQTIIEFQWSDNQLSTFLFTKDTFLVFQIPNSEDLQAAIYQFNFLAQKQPDLSGDQQVIDAENFVRLARFLYDQLIIPIQPYVKEELIIIPDSWLYFLPFECLIKEQGENFYHFRSHQYLIQEVAISYNFAASLAIDKKNTHQNFKEQLLIIAPSFINDSRQLKELKFSKDEVTKVSNILTADIWEDKKALKTSFVESAKDYQILHLASHGIMDNQNPDYSFIAFTELPDNIGNEVLYVSEIYNIDLNADLIVLSACQTAKGKLYRGEGLLSIAHAFIYAGAKSIIASLWNVDDEQTPALMEKFYISLNKGLTKPKAIQQAKNDYLKSAIGFKAHPYYWSGFMVIGNTQSLDIANSSNLPNYLTIFLITSTLVIILAIFRRKIISKNKLI